MSDTQTTGRPEILTVQQLADEFGISAGKVYLMANKGELPSVRFGRVFRFRRATVEAWLAARERGATV